MAGLDGTITIQSGEYRPCVVNGKKALFHKWEAWSEIVPPSPMIGGHGGGVITGTWGIVEYEDGSVSKEYPSKIRFVDNKLKDYVFPEDTQNEP